MSELREQIESVIQSEDVALFMKGTPQFVMCGNSSRALDALRRAGAPVTAVDVLPDPRIRQELSAVWSRCRPGSNRRLTALTSPSVRVISSERSHLWNK